MKKIIIGVFASVLLFTAGTALAYSTGTISTNKSSCYIPLGASTCQVSVYWNTTNPVYPSALVVGNGNVVAVSNYGSKTFDIPYGGVTFSLYNGNLLLNSANVTSSCVSGANWNGSRCMPNINPAYTCMVSSFKVNGSSSIQIFPGDPVTLSWATSNCNNVSISEIGRNFHPNGSYLLYPKKTATYTINGYSSSGAVSAGKSIYVTIENPTPTPIYNLKAVTSIATNITTNSANLNALMTNLSAPSANVYFEYGKTINLGLKTPEQKINSNTNFDKVVNNLSSNTIYYFRAVSEENGQISLGKIEVFKTAIKPIKRSTNKVVSKTVVITPDTKNSNFVSPLELNITNKYKAIGQGDIIEYTILYKNNTKTTIVNPVLQIIAPDGLDITNCSAGGTYNKAERTLEVKLNNLAAGKGQIIYAQAKVKSLPANVSQFITTALMSYNNSDAIRKDVMAYVLNTPKKATNSSLGATATYSGNTDINFIGLLLIITAILLIILVISKYFYKPKTVEVLHTENKEK